MNSKALLIAIAAFAVTTTGAQAYVGQKTLTRAGLSSEQIAALEVARGLQEEGQIVKARDVLVGAGVDEEALMVLHAAAKAAREAVRAAVSGNDYAAFRDAVVDTPLADIITTEADFELFSEAYTLRAAGQYAEAGEIFDELGVPESLQGQGHHKKRGKSYGYGSHSANRIELSDEQRDALRAARQANDRATMRAILDEAGERDGWGRYQ